MNGKTKPNVIPLNGRWMLLFKIHLAVVGPILGGLFAIAGWAYHSISSNESRLIRIEAQFISLRDSFEDVRIHGSPITDRRLSVIEDRLQIKTERPKP